MARQPKPDSQADYHIRIQGHLGPEWADWFGDISITLEDNGDTVLTCTGIDQAALHGLLRKVRDTGMTLRSVVQNPTDQQSTHTQEESK